MQQPTIISKGYRPRHSGVDFIEAARVTWQRSRAQSARLLRRTRVRVRHLVSSAEERGFQRGVHEGRIAALDYLKASLTEATTIRSQLEEAILQKVILSLKEALRDFINDNQDKKFIADYVERCLRIHGAHSEFSIRVHPNNSESLANLGIPIIADPSLPKDFVDFELPEGTLRFSWFRDIINAFEKKVRSY